MAGDKSLALPYKQEPVAKTEGTAKKGRPHSLPQYKEQLYFSIYIAEGCVKESYISKAPAKIQTREQDRFEDGVGGLCIDPLTSKMRGKYAVKDITHHYGEAKNNPAPCIGEDYELSTTARDHYLMIRSGRRDFLVTLIETYLASYPALKKQRAVGSIMVFANAVVFLTPFKYSYRGEPNSNEVDSLLAGLLNDADGSFHWLPKSYIQSQFALGKMRELTFATSIKHPRSPSFTCDTPRTILETALKGYLTRTASRLLERGDYDHAGNMLASLNKLRTETRAIVEGYPELESELTTFVKHWNKKLLSKQVKEEQKTEEEKEPEQVEEARCSEPTWPYSLILMKNCLNPNYISNSEAEVVYAEGSGDILNPRRNTFTPPLKTPKCKYVEIEVNDIYSVSDGTTLTGFRHVVRTYSDSHYLVVKHENMIGQEQVTNILKGLFFNPKLSKLEYSTDFGRILVFPNATVLLSREVSSTSTGERELIEELIKHSFRIYDDGFHWVPKKYIDKLLASEDSSVVNTFGFHRHVGSPDFDRQAPEQFLYIGCKGYFRRAVSYYLEKNDITSADAVINTLQMIVKEHGHHLSGASVKMVEEELSTLKDMRKKKLVKVSKKKEMQ